MKGFDFQKDIIPYVDTIENLLTSDIWNSLLMDCTKNELLILWLLYKKEEVNMTQIAESIHVPLNTATGIVTRMEKRQLLSRSRSAEDKRVVTIQMEVQGKKQMEAIIAKLTFLMGRVLSTLQPDEVKLLEKIFGKILSVMQEEKIQEEKQNQEPRQKLRKIEIM